MELVSVILLHSISKFEEFFSFTKSKEYKWLNFGRISSLKCVCWHYCAAARWEIQIVDVFVGKNTRKRKSSEILSEIQQENQRLKEARTCKICMDNEIEVALYPCGHLVSCVNCSFHLIDCPVCRKFIKRIVRTYMSWNFFHKYF